MRLASRVPYLLSRASVRSISSIIPGRVGAVVLHNEQSPCCRLLRCPRGASKWGRRQLRSCTSACTHVGKPVAFILKGLGLDAQAVCPSSLAQPPHSRHCRRRRGDLRASASTSTRSPPPLNTPLPKLDSSDPPSGGLKMNRFAVGGGGGGEVNLPVTVLNNDSSLSSHAYARRHLRSPTTSSPLFRHARFSPAPQDPRGPHPTLRHLRLPPTTTTSTPPLHPPT